MQRSIAQQINLKQIIGQGRFGEVHLGQWRGEVLILNTVFPHLVSALE